MSAASGQDAEDAASRSGDKPSPDPLGNASNHAIADRDGGLLVDGTRLRSHNGHPPFGVGHGVVRQGLVTQMGKNRNVNDPEGFIATPVGVQRTTYFTMLTR